MNSTSFVMAIAPPFTFSNNDKTFPARIRGLQRLSQQGFRRAITFARSETDISIAENSMLGAELHANSRPVSRASVLSLTSLSAWNRTSMMSTTDTDNDKLEYRLHRPSTANSTHSDISSVNSSSLSLAENITKLNSTLPGAAEFETASNVHGLIPPMKRFALPSPKPLPQESWPDFVERVLQPEACRPTATRRLSSSELSSLTSPTADHDQVIIEGPQKWSEGEWLDMENAVIGEARVVKEGDVKVVKKGDVKLIDVPKPKKQCATGSEGYQHKSFHSADVGVSQSLLDVLSKVVTKARSADGLQHNVLPYQPYRQPFDPFEEGSSSPDAESPSSSLSKSERRKCSIVQSSSNIELHLPPLATVITPPSPPAAVPAPLNINKVSWLDTADARPLDGTITAALDKVTGLLTRKLTNASPLTPGRVVMNSAFPFFPRSTPVSLAEDNRRHSCPILCEPIATPASDLTIRPKPGSQDLGFLHAPASSAASKTTRPEAKRSYSMDLDSGLLTRSDTVAAERQNPNEVFRTVMNQSYPVFLKRDGSSEVRLGTAHTGIRARPRLIKTKKFEENRLSLPVIKEVTTPPSTSRGDVSVAEQRKDSALDETEVKDFATTAVPDITVTSPSITTSSATGSISRSTTSTTNSEHSTTLDALLSTSTAAPVATDVARTVVDAADFPTIPTGPGHKPPRAPKKLVKRRPVPSVSPPVSASLLSLPSLHDISTHHPKSFASRVAHYGYKRGDSKPSTTKEASKLKSKKSLKQAASESVRELKLRHSAPQALGSHPPGRKDFVSGGVPVLALELEGENERLGEVWGRDVGRVIEGIA